MEVPFGGPEGEAGGYVTTASLTGRPLIIYTVGVWRGLTNKYHPNGDGDAVVVDIVDLTTVDERTGEPVVHRCVALHQGTLIKALKNRVGAPPVLVSIGRAHPANLRTPCMMVTHGVPCPNDGYTVIYLHTDSTVLEMGQSWLAAHPAFTPSELPPIPVPSDQGSGGGYDGWPAGSRERQQWGPPPQQQWGPPPQSVNHYGQPQDPQPPQWAREDQGVSPIQRQQQQQSSLLDRIRRGAASPSDGGSPPQFPY